MEFTLTQSTNQCPICEGTGIRKVYESLRPDNGMRVDTIVKEEKCIACLRTTNPAEYNRRVDDAMDKLLVVISHYPKDIEWKWTSILRRDVKNFTGQVGRGNEYKIGKKDGVLYFSPMDEYSSGFKINATQKDICRKHFWIHDNVGYYRDPTHCARLTK